MHVSYTAWPTCGLCQHHQGIPWLTSAALGWIQLQLLPAAAEETQRNRVGTTLRPHIPIRHHAWRLRCCCFGSWLQVCCCARRYIENGFRDWYERQVRLQAMLQYVVEDCCRPRLDGCLNGKTAAAVATVATRSLKLAITSLTVQRYTQSVAQASQG